MCNMKVNTTKHKHSQFDKHDMSKHTDNVLSSDKGTVHVFAVDDHNTEQEVKVCVST